MASDEFDKVELPALEQLQSWRWSYVEDADGPPVRDLTKTPDPNLVEEQPYRFLVNLSICPLVRSFST